MILAAARNANGFAITQYQVAHLHCEYILSDGSKLTTKGMVYATKAVFFQLFF